jgi:NADH-quinone oxidoreductase subunit M
MSKHLLTFLVFAPLFWGLLLMLLGEKQQQLAKYLGLAGSLGIFVVSAFRLLSAGAEPSGVLVAEHFPWFSVGGLPVEYSLSVDGLNLWLVLLTTFLVPLTLLGTWDSVSKKVGTFIGLFLILECGMLGALMAQDLLFFYLFWEAMLIPMYFLIGVWGGDERRYAANKFFLYTLAGSLLWLVALLFLATKAGSFNPTLMAQAALGLSFSAQCWLFLAFALAFAIKVPLFPLHTWLPDAHVQAPTAGSVILAGVLLKLGCYGFVRFALPMFPGAALHYAKPLALLSVLAIVYGALVAMMQRDIKKLVAYSSVSHMGFVMLGIASMTVIGTQGAMLQMLNHGISTGALFLLVGMLYDRAHTRMISDFGGVATKMPIFTGFFLVITLSSIGLPLTNGFVGEFLILNGAYVSGGLYQTVGSVLEGSFQAWGWTHYVGSHYWLELPLNAVLRGITRLGWNYVTACAATLGVVLGAAYMLWMFKRVFWGEANPDEGSGTAHLHDDLNLREIAVLVPITILVFWMGLHPRTFLGASEAPVVAMLQAANAPAPRLRVPEPEPKPGPGHVEAPAVEAHP